MPIQITPDLSWPLHGIAATRAIERAATAALPPHTLMQRAGLAVARLACALAPHAQSIWIACGPGNNGGDGLEAAMHLQRWGHRPVVTLCGDEARLPPDAAASLARARAAGVTLASAPPAHCDLAIDALLGIGGAGHAASGPRAQRALPHTMANWLLHMHSTAQTVLSVDLPSGLDADTGTYADSEFTTKLIAACATIHWPRRLFCLSLLTLKPGLFTAQGKDAAGPVWWDDLACQAVGNTASDALLLGADRAQRPPRLHASHKGSYGDVAIIGGAPGMTGAALLAARAALHAGAGRVLVGLLDGASMAVDTAQPELMFRPLDALDLRAQHGSLRLWRWRRGARRTCPGAVASPALGAGCRCAERPGGGCLTAKPAGGTRGPCLCHGADTASARSCAFAGLHHRPSASQPLASRPATGRAFCLHGGVKRRRQHHCGAGHAAQHQPQWQR